MKRWLALAGKPTLLLGGLAAAGFAIRGLGLDGRVAAAGEQGPAAFLGIAVLACAVGIPRQVVAYAGGFAFGFWPGSALALLAEMLGCVVDFLWARAVARGWATRWLRRTGGGRLDRLDRFLVAHAFTATLTIRLLPVGNNLAFNLMAGVSGVAAAPFLAASLLGYIPQTVVFALLGGGVRVSQSAQIGLAVVLFAASILLGALLLRRHKVPA